MLKRTAQNIFYSSSVNKQEMELFSKLTGWWHPSGPSQILFVYNYKRIQFLRKFLKPKDLKQPLKGLKVLDVGCGAGFLSQSMTRLGADVTGIDPSSTSFSQATKHKNERDDLTNLCYHNLSLEQFLTNAKQKSEDKFDIVTSMEVIEHVDHPQKFIDTLSSCTKEGGYLMLSTIRRSNLSWLTHILIAERILNIVPEGTHHHDKFINPSECQNMMKKSGYDPLEILELQLNWKGQFEQKKNGSNYLVIGKKKGQTYAKSKQ